MYTERAYRDEMLTTNVPEIQRTNLSSTVLSLKVSGHTAETSSCDSVHLGRAVGAESSSQQSRHS